ncbi:MAG: hypothetical protein N3G78_14780 [Desulfobacterota bacterium]|nr:hypothetical protein [Thermodesulfobacteriota bacterium]
MGEVDIPLTDLFCCPVCGYRGALKADPVVYVQCICGKWWVIGDYHYYLSLSDEEREELKRWYASLYKDHGEFDYEIESTLYS